MDHVTPSLRTCGATAWALNCAQVKAAFLFCYVGQGRGCSLGAQIARTGFHLCGPCCADCAERIAALPTVWVI